MPSRRARGYGGPAMTIRRSLALGLFCATHAFAQTPASSAEAACKFPGQLPDDAKVFAAGGHYWRKLPYSLDPRSNSEGGEYSVQIHHPDAPVVLMLGSYGAAIWRVSWSPGTRIVGIYLSGYYRQDVIGIPGTTPVLRQFAMDRGPCPYFWVTEEELLKLNPVARSVLARPVSRVFYSENGRIRIGNPPDGTKLVDAGGDASSAAFGAAPELAGSFALDHAIRNGAIRKATQKDFDDWRSANARLAAGREPPVRPVGARPDTRSAEGAYVVLGPFKYPPGLYGANAVTFLIPKGVATPSGNAGHSQILDFNKLP